MYSASICCVKEIYCSLRSSNLHIHFFPFHQENAPDDIASLKKELAAIRQLHDAGSVDSALSLLRQHLARPSGIFDPHADLAALEQLVDVARDKSDERASRFSIVLRQTRPLFWREYYQNPSCDVSFVSPFRCFRAEVGGKISLPIIEYREGSQWLY